jgi:hypothetical protein
LSIEDRAFPIFHFAFQKEGTKSLVEAFAFAVEERAGERRLCPLAVHGEQIQIPFMN